MQTSRRRFIKTSASLALGYYANTFLAAASTRAKPVPIGFQLYAARGEFSRDVPATLNRIAKIGYEGVEFWGYGGTQNIYKNYSARDLRRFLDDAGLKCCGIHVDVKALESENFKTTLENCLVLEIPFINVAAAREKMKSEEGIAGFADLLNRRAKESAAHKLAVGYHSHPFDFEKIGERYTWEILFKRLDRKVNMQLDIGNCLAGKADPIALLKEFPRRIQTAHLKERDDKTFDSDFYKQIFKLCESSGIKWYIVEMGGPNGNGFDIPQRAFEKLQQLGR